MHRRDPRSFRSYRFSTVAFLGAVLLGSACGHPPLSEASQQLLADRVATATSEVVYIGSVASVAPALDGVLFRYERRAEADNISHLTFTPDGDAVLWQGVRLAANGTLGEMEVIHAQLGLAARAVVDGNTIVLTTTVGDGAEEVTELSFGADVVVGPTLFQYLLQHREDLASGVEFDFLSLENRGVFRFAASLGDAPGTFVIRPLDPLVALTLPSFLVVYNDDTEQMVSYQGAVPPVLEDGRTFEARVTYTSEIPFR